GTGAFLLVWGALSSPPRQPPVAGELVGLAEKAHAKDVVTAILADFRALDTLGEISVVAVALLTLVALLPRGRGS
ncbi:MAG: hypothetical protein M3N16_08405, partial [Actinomycetota bacterium]|nr:hypothetical protein [Actinomycetota bacterium]